MPAFAIALAGSAWAQAAKFAVIDMQGALLKTQDGQKAAAELQSKFGPKETEFTKHKTDLEAKQEQYRKTANTMSDAAKASAERDIQNITRDLQREGDDAKADFQAEETRLLGGIMDKMRGVLDKYAADNQIAMIVDLSSQPNNLLYASESTNITAAVISAYDKSAVPLAAPPPAAARPPAASPRPPASSARPPASSPGSPTTGTPKK